MGAEVPPGKKDVHDVGTILNGFGDRPRAIETGAARHGALHVDVAHGSLDAVQRGANRRLNDGAIRLTADAEWGEADRGADR